MIWETNWATEEAQIYPRKWDKRCLWGRYIYEGKVERRRKKETICSTVRQRNSTTHLLMQHTEESAPVSSARHRVLIPLSLSPSLYLYAHWGAFNRRIWGREERRTVADKGEADRKRGDNAKLKKTHTNTHTPWKQMKWKIFTETQKKQQEREAANSKLRTATGAKDSQS